MKTKTRHILTGYAFISFWLIGLLIFTIWPLIQSVWYSFNTATFNGNHIELTFSGFGNFIYAFKEDNVLKDLLNKYLAGIIIQAPFSVAASLIISMLLNRKMKMRALWRGIFFLPVIICTGPVLKELMSAGSISLPESIMSGMEGFVLEYLPAFISTPILLLFDNLIIVLWFTGIPTLVFLAGLQRIDKSAYEAASIDGASPWQSFWKITLPSMKSFILVNIIYSIVTLSFADIPASDGTQNILEYMQSHMFKQGGKGYGYACAVGLIYFIIILIQIGFYALILAPKRERRGNR